jgi:hypothetical protein
MFERFTADAKRTVTRAVEVAEEIGDGHLGAEHLLIALAGTGPSIATEALIACGFDPRGARLDLERIELSEGSDLSEADAVAHRGIGVDLDEVRRRIEPSFGPGALDRRPLWHGRRRGRVCGLPVMPMAKQALELALREAIRPGPSSDRSGARAPRVPAIERDLDAAPASPGHRRSPSPC